MIYREHLEQNIKKQTKSKVFLYEKERVARTSEKEEHTNMLKQLILHMVP